MCIERKYEDISRKMATLDADAARGNERADGAEKKILDLEEELKVEFSLMSMQQLSKSNNKYKP